MKRLMPCLMGLTVSAVAGCIPSQDLHPGDMSRHWLLSPELSRGATRKTMELGDVRLPSRWTIRYEPSVLRSTISIVRGMDALEEGVDEVEFSVSPSYTRAIKDVLMEMRGVVEGMADLAEGTREDGDRQRWARIVADQLIHVERISRQTSRDPDDRPGDEEPFGLAAEPFLGMLVTYLNEQSEGKLMDTVSREDMQQLRTVLAQLTLRVGFAMSGRQMPEGFRENLVAQMAGAEDPDRLQQRLERQLIEAAADSPPSSAALDDALYIALKSAPKVLEMLESFLDQWDRMESIELELLERDGRGIVALSINVQPDREVRLGEVMILQPTLAFRGSTRIVVIPKLPVTEETSILFEPRSEDSAAELRFDHPLYFFVRLFAMPLEDARLREVRVFRRSASQGLNMLHVSVFMEAAGGGEDRRRMIVVQDSQVKHLIREPFNVQSVAERRTTVASYITPSRRYTFQRTKDAAEETADQPAQP